MAATPDTSGVNNPNYKGYMHRKCRQCAGPINGSSATRKYCSRACQAAAYRVASGSKQCPACGKDFYHRQNKHCSAECALFMKVSNAKNPGVRARRQERKASGLFTGLIGRPPGVRQPRVCTTCAKGFMVRPCEADQKFCSRECYGKAVGDRQRGDKHHNYKDGKAESRISERQRMRRHPDYRKWRDAVFMRDAHTCRSCRATGCALEAHHHTSWVDNPKLRMKVSNGITLCKSCHRLWHAYDKKGMFVGKESLLQSKVIDALREYGFFVVNVPGTPMGANGVADLIVCYRGIFGALECKVFPNYLSELQRVSGERVSKAGGIFYVVQSEDDIGRIIEIFETYTPAGGSWVLSKTEQKCE